MTVVVIVVATIHSFAVCAATHTYIFEFEIQTMLTIFINIIFGTTQKNKMGQRLYVFLQTFFIYLISDNGND